MRGRPQKSRKMKLLTERRKQKTPPPLEGINPDTNCPDHISGYSRELWENLLPKLQELELITKLDLSSFEILCLNYGLMRESHKLLMEQGCVIGGERGSYKKHPIFTVYKTASEVFLKASEHFGLSPRSREVLSIQVSEKTDPLEDFLRERGIK